jgi:hypothetical protein
MYIYRVTAKLVKLADGRKAHVAQYAYKPWGFGDRKENQRLHFKTGCVASENMELKSDLIVTLDDHEHEGNLYHNHRHLRVFLDDATFGTEHMPKLGTVERANRPFGDTYSFTPKAVA